MPAFRALRGGGLVHDAAVRLRSRAWRPAASSAVVAAYFVTRPCAADLRRTAASGRRRRRPAYQRRIYAPDIAEAAALAEAMTRSAAETGRRLDGAARSTTSRRPCWPAWPKACWPSTASARHQLNRPRPPAGRLPTEADRPQLAEVVRNADLLRLSTSCSTTHEPIEGDVVLRHADERVLQVRGTVSARFRRARPFGAVIVLNDVTRLRRLENIRRDFVANVSHELKTPITSIKGFVETLLDGASNDPEDAERFLQIIAKQADRLHAIIEDLLSLSKIEQREDADDIALEAGRAAADVLESARARSASRPPPSTRSTVALECDRRLRARINPALLEQAVVNLLDNAIKYSEPGARGARQSPRRRPTKC